MAGEIDPKSAAELAENVKLVGKFADETLDSFQKQLKVVTQMRDAMEEIAKIMYGLSQEDFKALNSEAWSKVTKEVRKNSSALTDSQRAMKESSNAAKSLAKAMKSSLATAAIVATTAVTGLYQGFKNFVGMGRAITGLFTSIAGGAFSIGRSILAIPFKMLNGLINMAKKGAGGNELAAAYEDVRKEFGDLSKGGSKAIIDTALSMDTANQSGLNMYRVFGNTAERLKAVKEMASGMGMAFQVFKEEVDKNGTAIMLYNKGLGITPEQMAGITSNAIRMGKSVTQVQNDMTKQALGMAKAFGLDAKVLSKDMAKGMQDLAHFGSLSTKEMAVATAYANKLGVSVEKLTGIMDATATFDQAAEGMSKLNEQFGTNIDATELMMEENPAKQVAILQREFAKAGKDFSKMDRFQKNLIKSSTGLGDEILNTALNAKNAGVSIDKMSKQGDKNENQVLSQADAMKELASSIERLTPSGSAGEGGIWSHFFSGFTTGLQSTKEFREVMHNINKVLRIAFQYGLQLGKEFVNLFPGVKQVLGGFRDIFDPERFRALFGGVLKAFDVFKVGGTGKIEDFIKAIKETFSNYFKSGEGPATQVLEGFKQMGKVFLSFGVMIGNYIVDGLIKIVPKITEFIPKLFAFMRDPKASGAKLPEANVPEWAKPLIDLFIKIKETLWPEIKKMFSVLWTELKPILKEGLKDMLIASFVPAAFSTVIGAGASLLKNSIVDGILHATGNLGDKEAGFLAKKFSGILEKGFEGAKSTMASKAGSILSKAALPLLVATAAVDVSSAIKEFSGQLQEKGFDPATSKIAAGTTGIINALTLGLLPKDLQGKIAESIAKISDYLFKAMDKVFGPSFSASIKRWLTAAFDIFGGLGDLLKAMWNGDSKGVMDALGTIGMGIINGFIASFDMIANAVLKLGPLIFEYLMKALEMVSSKLGDIFLSLKEIYIIGPIAELIGNIFKFLAEIFNASGKGWKLIGEFFKNIWVSFEELPGKVAAWGKGMIEAITKPFTEGWQKVKDIFGDGVNKVKDFLGIHSPSKVFQDIGKNMADGVDQSLQKVPENAEKTFKKTADIASKATSQSTTGPSGPSPAMNPQDVEVAAKIITMITDLIKAIGSAIGGAPASGEVNPASVQAITAAVPTIMSLIDGIKKKAGPLVLGLTEVIKSIPNDPQFKDKLKTASEFFDFIGKLTKITSLLDVPNQVPGQGPVNSILLNLDWIDKLMYGMTHNWMSDNKNSIKNIVRNMKEIFTFMPVGLTQEVPKLANFINGVSALINAFKDPFQSVSLAKNQGAVNSVLLKLNEVDMLMWGMTHNWLAGNKNSIKSIVDNARLVADAVSATAKRDAVNGISSALKIVEQIVATTQKLDNALSKLPKINLQTRLTEVAGMAGLGASGIYTVQSKEVIINVKFTIQMDAGKVEKAILMNTESIIRDRINFALGGGQGKNAVVAESLKPGMTYSTIATNVK